MDHASGLYVRFRLGGTMFPPLIYYKVFTKTAVTDLNAFAPRHYHSERKAAHKPHGSIASALEKLC